jgi:2-methylcitrate dehydratase PrpD
MTGSTTPPKTQVHIRGRGSPVAAAEEIVALAEWAAGVEAADIDDAVYRQAAIVVCDDLAAMVSARDDPVLSKVCDRLLRDGGRPVATVFRGGRPRTDRYSAALANGAAGPWNELDEGSRRVSCHAGVYALPALLAEAEAEGTSTRETLRCLIVAYEVVTRYALAFPQRSLLLHPHASLCAIGAAASIAAARRYDPVLFLAALTTSTTLVNPGPFDHAVRGSLIRNMWTAHGAWAGLRAADWALCGITGSTESPRDVFHHVFQCECDPDRLVADLGQDWLINHNFQKIYPCCQYAHSMVEAIEGLVPTLEKGVKLRNCENVVIEIHEHGQRLNEVHPETILAARFSVPHIAAVAAIHGRVDVETLSPASLLDPEVVDLRQRVSILPFEPPLPPPNDRPARVRFRFSDGSQYHAECLCARGSPSTPFGFEIIRRKVAGLCEEVYPRMAEVMDRLADLDEALFRSSWDNVVARITGET